MRVASLLAAVLAAATARGHAADPPLAARRHLADERAVAEGAAAASTVAIGYTTRYVFAAPRTVLVQPVEPPPARVPPSGVVDLRVACPAEVAGETVAVTVASPAHGVSALPRPLRCEVAGAPVAIRFPAEPGATLGSAAAVFHVAPPTTFETGWLDVAVGARLRMALGLASPLPMTTRTGARFRVAAVAEDGTRSPVLERALEPARRTADVAWQEVDAPLPPGRLRLAFEADPLGEGAPPFAVWGDPVVLAPAPDDTRRNVIVVSLDTLRADRLGAYGAVRRTSPFFDALAVRSALFDVALASAPHTFPSHATILSGLYQCASGLGLGGGTLFQAFARGVVPVPEALRRVGYTTVAFTEDAFLDALPFQRGFGAFRGDKTATSENAPVGDAPGTFAEARSWLRTHAGERFFLLVHTYQVHQPYTPPGLFAGLFDPDDGTPQPDIGFSFRAMLARYDAEIRYTDGLLEGFFAELQALGLDERTIVVVLSDHGQEFGEHGFHGHGHTVWEEVLRVPLLWYAPGLVIPGRRTGGVVGTVDVVPTLYELLDVPAPHELQGVSLAATLTRGAPLDPARWVVARGLAADAPTTLRAATWKMIRSEKGEPSWYDLAADPHERSPRQDDEARRALGLLEQYEGDCERLRRGFRGEAPPPTAAPDPERERKLRALGYVE